MQEEKRKGVEDIVREILNNGACELYCTMRKVKKMWISGCEKKVR